MAKNDDDKIKRIKDADKILVLYLKNLDAIRVFYRKETVAGQVLGHNSMLEIVFGHQTMALELALQGKDWKPL